MKSSHSEIKNFVRMTGADGPRLVPLPGLDGLRGVAVAVVVLYHLGFEWMRGGYLGVSTFFTLSGFLITTILLNEADRQGKPSLRAFWIRRFRRLMPAALVSLCLVAIVFGRSVATADQRLALRGDVLAALGYVANWRFVFSGTAYGDFTRSPSPLLHFWSLSIEEQFYLLFPAFIVVVIFLLRRAERRRHAVIISVLVALAALSASLPVLFDMDTNRAYLGSDVRAAEILMGGVLATLLIRRRVRQAIVVRTWLRRALFVAAGLATVIQIYWFVNVGQSSRGLYRGGLPLFAALTCILITAASHPLGPFRQTLGSWPLRWMGTRSYGIYLFHWPLLLAIRQSDPTLGPGVVALILIPCTGVLAELSYRYVEMPVRAGKWPPPAQVFRYGAASIVVVALLASVPIGVDRSELTTDFDRTQRDLDELRDSLNQTRRGPSTSVESGPTVTDRGATTTVASPPPQASAVILGDSTAMLVAGGLLEQQQAGTEFKLTLLDFQTELGCGISRFVEHRFFDVRTVAPVCHQWPTLWSGSIENHRPDMSIIITAAWEVLESTLPGTGEWVRIGEPAADEFIRSELEQAVEAVTRNGDLAVLWLWPPYAPWSDNFGKPAVIGQHDPARMVRLHELIRDVAAEHPEVVRVFDFQAFLGAQRLADKSIRPDGHHVPVEVMRELWVDGLDQAMYDIFAQWWRAQHH